MSVQGLVLISIMPRLNGCDFGSVGSNARPGRQLLTRVDSHREVASSIFPHYADFALIETTNTSKAADISLPRYTADFLASS
jgi:hypothetical protein